MRGIVTPIRRVVSAIVLATWAAGSSGTTAHGDVVPHGLFTSGMVLQQGMRVPVWGRADEGETVTVRFQDQEVTTVATDGRWQVELAPLSAGGPFEMEIVGDRMVLLTNVLVGEVWICAGESNMQWPVVKALGSAQAITAASNPRLRLFTVPRREAAEPTVDVSGSWDQASGSTVSFFSAVGYYFGRELEQYLGVPVGLISANYGPSPAEAWMSRPALAEDSQLKPLLEAAPRVTSRSSPTGLYNGMIHPLVPLAVRGVIWYQGESNVTRADQYRTLLPALIRDWRRAWGQEGLAFLFVQVAPFRAVLPVPGESQWAELRESQRLVAREVPNTAMVVTTDVGESNDLHPRKKEPVGVRLALAARGTVYAEEVEYSGPMYRSMQIKSGRVYLSFDHVGGGLVAEGGRLTGFSIAGPDRRFVFAEAEIEGEQVVVHSPEVTQPVAARYGWTDYPVVNLWNKAGLPASPFRTDSFPTLTGPRP